MKAFDESCTMQLLLLDSRIKYLIQDEDGKVILSPIGTFCLKVFLFEVVQLILGSALLNGQGKF